MMDPRHDNEVIKLFVKSFEIQIKSISNLGKTMKEHLLMREVNVAESLRIYSLVEVAAEFLESSVREMQEKIGLNVDKT